MALNRQRLPVSKEATIEAYRGQAGRGRNRYRRLVRAAAGLSIIAVTANFHWEKALGDADELAWWMAQVV